VGGRYSDEWHRIHFRNPRDVVPESNMPAYPYLQHAAANAGSIQAHMRALRRLGVPYTEEEITNAPKELEGKTEEDALIAYMQGLGIHRRSTNTAATTNSAVSIGK
jgi:cytochrome c oxidase cbb3-type subunit 2